MIINDTCWFKGRRDDLLDLKKMLKQIVSSADREQAVRHTIEQQFILGRTAPDQLGALQKQCSILNLFCSLQAVCLLVWLPVVLCRMPTEWLLWRVGAPALLLHLICGLLFLRTHAHVAPHKKGLRWESLVKMFLCPPMIIRAVDVVMGSTQLDGDSASILMACADPSKWKRCIQDIWRQSIPYRRNGLPQEAAQAQLDFSETYRSNLAAELKTHGVDAASLDINASTVSATESYCPRCGAVFNSNIKTCSDCDGLELQRGEKG